jgi:hypothetical protein
MKWVALLKHQYKFLHTRKWETILNKNSNYLTNSCMDPDLLHLCLFHGQVGLFFTVKLSSGPNKIFIIEQEQGPKHY